MKRTRSELVLGLTCAALVGLSALIALIGWWIKSAYLIQIDPTLVPMRFNAALCFLLCTIGLAMAEARLPGAWIPSAIAFAFGTLTLLQYWGGLNLGIDRLFMAPFLEVPGSEHPGRMTINSALGFAICGSALAFCAASRKTGPVPTLAVALAGSIVGAIGIIAFISDLFGIETAGHWGKYTHMGVRPALGFILLSVPIIHYAKERNTGSPLWLPLPIFLGLLTATLSIVQAVDQARDIDLRKLVEAKARHSAQLTEQHLDAIARTLIRFGLRWQNQGGVPRRQWQPNADAIVQDFPSLRAIFWADQMGRVQWSAERRGSESFEGLDLTTFPEVIEQINIARIERSPRATPALSEQSAAVRGTFLLVRPLFIADEYHGVLGAVMDIQSLFRGVLNSTGLDGIGFVAHDNDRQIYSDQRDIIADSPIASNVPIKVLGRSWHGRAVPRHTIVRQLTVPKPTVILFIGSVISLILAYCSFLYLIYESIYEKLKEKEERLALAVSGTQDGLWDLDLRTDRLYCSPRLLAILRVGDRPGPATSKDLIDRIHPDDREIFVAALQEHISKASPFDVSFRISKQTDGELWLNARGRASRDTDGVPARMTGFISDISRQKEVERLKSEFVSTVSHELRTPLTSIRGALSLVCSGALGPLSAKVQQMVDIAHKNGERLILLINDILDLDKIESGQVHFEFSERMLNELLGNAVEANRTFAMKDDVQLVLNGLEKDGAIDVDPDRFHQVLTNLISNAAKFSPPGGAVTIGADRRGGKLRISVSDHGPGIPEEFRQRIFGKFAQSGSPTSRKQSGTGLGLNISRQIIRQMRGDIGFETEVGKGTTFWVELPELCGNDSKDTAPVRFSPDAEDAPILICEDDVGTAKVLDALLLREGFQSVTARSLPEAREFLERMDVKGLILDLVLPDGNSLDLIREIRAKGNPLPILITSLKAGEGKAALNGGAVSIVDWMKKQVDPQALSTTLRRWIAAGPQRQIRILHVNADAGFHRAIAYSMKHEATFIEAATVEEGFHYLMTSRFDLMIADLSLANGSCLSLLQHLGSFQFKLPVILLSSEEVDGQICARVAASLIESRVSERKIVQLIAGLVGRPHRSEAA